MADAIKRCADSLRALEAGASSRAESVTALLEQRDTLVDGIGRAEGRYRAAGDALETYSAALDRVQTDTLNALYAARQATWERDEARDNQHYYQDLADDYANTDDDSGYGHDQQVRYTRLANSAGQEAAAAQERIDNQVQVAQNAVQERDQAAQTAIDAIQRATTTDGLNDGRWEDYGAKILGWIADLAQAIAQFAGILAMALCWIPVLGPALAVIAAIAGIVEAVANIGLAIGGEKSWGEALLSVGFAALGCIGLGGLRGAVSSLKALKNFGGALKTAGGLKGAFLTFAKSTIPPGARDALLKFGQRLRIAANRKNLYVKGKTLQPGTKGRDLLASKSPYGRRFGRRIKNSQEWELLYRTGPDLNDVAWPNPCFIEGSKRSFNVDEYIRRYGDTIDRIGGGTGKWFSPVEKGRVFSFEARAVPRYHLEYEYNQIRLVEAPKDWTIEVSVATPGFGQPGGALQIQFISKGREVSFAELLDKSRSTVW
ncbi:glycohydrolase toxin TNT-related protein [Buchananella felis]|uniref:glycohydrolase toxin TNT-related protein n=1 Tax=Buchananella felis TaxID=3231492 RepID=UPI003529CB5D